jgi:hypothetical protein
MKTPDGAAPKIRRKRQSTTKMVREGYAAFMAKRQIKEPTSMREVIKVSACAAVKEKERQAKDETI